MKKRSKKVARFFKIRADLDSQLSNYSEGMGMSKTRILEDALDLHFSKFADNMRKKLEVTIKEGKLNFKRPLAPEPILVTT